MVCLFVSSTIAQATYLECDISGYRKEVFRNLEDKPNFLRNFLQEMDQAAQNPLWKEPVAAVQFEGWRWNSMRDHHVLDNYQSISFPSPKGGAIFSENRSLKKFPGYPGSKLRYSVMIKESDRGFAEVSLELTDVVNKQTATATTLIRVDKPNSFSASLNRLDGGLLDDNELGRLVMSCKTTEATTRKVEREEAVP